MEPYACVLMFICGIYIHADVKKKKLGQCLKFNAKDFTSKMFVLVGDYGKADFWKAWKE